MSSANRFLGYCIAASVAISASSQAADSGRGAAPAAPKPSNAADGKKLSHGFEELFEQWKGEIRPLDKVEPVAHEAMARYLDARLYATRDNYDKALDMLTKAEAARKSPHVESARVWTFLEAGRFTDAITEGEKFVAAATDKYESHVALATAHHQAYSQPRQTDADRSNHRAKAIEQFEAARKISPASLEILDPLGTLYWEDYKQATSETQRTTAATKTLEIHEAIFQNSVGRYRLYPLLVMGIVSKGIGKTEEAVRYLSTAIELNPHHISAYSFLGEILEEEGKLPEAEKTYRKAVIADPASLEVQGQLDSLLLKEGGSEKMVAFYKSLAGDFPNSHDINRLYAERLTRYGKLAEAAEAYGAVVKQDPADAESRFTLGDLLFRLKRGEEAKPILKEFEELNSDSPEKLSELATFYSQQNMTADATRVLKKGIEIAPAQLKISMLNQLGAQLASDGELEQAVAALEESIKLRNTDPGSYYLLAKFYLDFARYDEALAVMDRAFANLDEKRQVDVLKQRSAILGMTKRWDESLQALDRARAIADKTRFAELDISRARLLAQASRMDDALKALDSARDESAGALTTEIELERAGVLTDLKRYNDAEQALLDLKRKTGDTEMAQQITLRLVDLYEESGRVPDAVQLLQTSVEKDPNNSEAYLSLGLLYDRTQQFDLAEGAYRKVIALDPDNADAYNNLGYMFAMRGVKLDEAETLIEKALQLSPGAGYILDSLGWALFKQGAYERAAAQLEAAVKQLDGDSGDADVLEHLGDTYMKLNRTKDARDVYGRALKADPENEPIKKKFAELGA